MNEPEYSVGWDAFFFALAALTAAFVVALVFAL